MYLRRMLSIYSILKTTGGLIRVALVAIVFLACTQVPQWQTALSQKQILTCDHTGQPSCYSTGYAAGLVNRGIDCSAFLLKLSGNSTQIVDYCSGNRAAQQQLQQQH
jgi:hypothetical protein